MSSLWQQRATLQNWSKIAMSDSGEVLYSSAYGGNGGGLYKSVDSGATWNRLDINVKFNLWTSIACSSTGQYVYACVSSQGTDSMGTWFSNDFGGTWTKSHLMNTNCLDIACSEDGSVSILLTKNNVYISLDYFSHLNIFYPAGTSSTVQWLSVACDGTGQNILIGTYGENLYLSTDVGATWTSFNPSGFNRIWNGVSLNSDGSYLIVAPFQNNLYISKNGGTSWTNLGLNKPFQDVCFDKTGEQIITSALNDYVYTSNNSGTSWDTRTPTLGPQQYTCISISKNVKSLNGILVPNNMFASGNILYLYQSTNGGSSCFVEGTNILSLKDRKIKEVKVEDLKIGDIVKISTGELKKIKNIGFNTIDFNTHPEYIRVMRKDSYSNNVPNKDLFVISGHSFLFNDLKYANELYTPEIYDNNIKPYKKIMASQCLLCEQATFQDVNCNNIVKYYHFSLESESDIEQFGIYSNGMLSESMSNKYFKDSGLVKK